MDKIVAIRSESNDYQLTIRRDNNPVDLVNGTIIQFAAKYRKTDPDEDAVIAIRAIITDHSNGLAELTISADNLAMIDRDAVLVYDVKIQEAGVGPITTMQQGVLIVEDAVTESII